MKIFITGISGFVGANLARFLIEKNHDVFGLTRPLTNLWRLQKFVEQVTLYPGDLLDKESIRSALLQAKPDVIVHLAVLDYHQKDLEKIFQTGAFSTLCLLETAKQLGVQMFINAGSSSEYGAKLTPMREDQLLQPNSLYAIGKAAQTHLVSYFSVSQKLPALTLRLFSVYGRYEDSNRFIPTLIRSALSNQDMPLNAAFNARDFIYVQDVCEACEKAMHLHVFGEVINLGSGAQHTLKDAFEQVKQLTKSSMNPKWGTYESREFDAQCWVADTSYAKKKIELGSENLFFRGLAKNNSLDRRFIMQFEKLVKLGEQVREHVIRMSFRAQTGETGSALCISDILVALYFSVMNIDPQQPKFLDRDRFILSKGHGAAALYAALALRGFFPEKWLEQYKTNGGKLHGHPCKESVIGIEASTGSLGHGLSIGAGMALAIRDQKTPLVWVLIGDGECNEGMIWEAAQFIGTRQLPNVKVIIDRNGWQGFGPLSETNNLPLERQWEAFGFTVNVCEGHDYKSLMPALETAKHSKQPHVVIANTVAGRGVTSIENTLAAHYFIAKQENLPVCDI